MRREEIRNQILRAEEKRTAVGLDRPNCPEDRPLEERLREREAYLAQVNRVLDARLTQWEYLTCADFDTLDVKCCDVCHEFYSHYETWDVTFSDGRHTWVCDPMHCVLMYTVRKDPLSPEQEQIEALLADIFGPRDSITQSLDSAIRAAESEEARLRATLRYVDHVHGRTRGDEPFEVVFERARELLRGTAAVAAESGKGLGPLRTYGG